VKSALIKSIQYQFKKLTNSNISQYQVKKFILPIVETIYYSPYNKFLLSGSQGVGKTTLLNLIKIIFKKKYNKKILSISLDDFYYDKRERVKIAKNNHPLLKTRGVPGTHDIMYLLDIIKRFDKSKYPLKLPLFDKLSDSRKKTQKLIKTKCDILILEGWCVGCPPISRKYLLSDINSIERQFDSNSKWREYYSKMLKNKYSKVFKKFNSTIYLKAPSFEHVLSWRIKQENYLRKLNKKNDSSGMSKKEIVEFIQHYEKITKWMLKKMPVLADMVLYINKDQKILRIKKNKKS
jgi:D-glycerate 3-kinase